MKNHLFVRCEFVKYPFYIHVGFVSGFINFIHVYMYVYFQLNYRNTFIQIRKFGCKYVYMRIFNRLIMKMYRTSKEKYLFERNRYYCLFSYMKKGKTCAYCAGIRKLPFPFRSFASYFKKIKRIIYRFNVHSFCRWNHKDEHYTVIVNIYIFRNRLLFIDVWKIKRFFFFLRPAYWLYLNLVLCEKSRDINREMGKEEYVISTHLYLFI